MNTLQIGTRLCLLSKKKRKTRIRAFSEFQVCINNSWRVFSLPVVLLLVYFVPLSLSLSFCLSFSLSFFLSFCLSPAKPFAFK